MEPLNIEEIIIAKLSDKTLSAGQEKLFEEWHADPANQEIYRTLLRQQAAAFAGEAGKADVRAAWERIAPRKRRPIGRTLLRYAAVVAVVAVAGTGVYLLSDKDDALVAQEKVLPGEFKAILTVGGQETFLSDRDTTAVTDGGKTIFSNTADGLKYTSDDLSGADDQTYNMLTVPRGGYYKIELSDGTQVWLNSETSLSFPATFKNSVRTVQVKGEAFFKVAANPAKPFVVRTDDYDIRVTGTEFNVRNYDDDLPSTTLVAGSVDVEFDGTVSNLKPGQQMLLTEEGMNIREVDTDDITAWRGGAFSFRSERLEVIMAELSRWYDIEVIWNDPADKDIIFSAWFSRDSDINAIIDLLRKTRRVDLSLEGNTLTVGI